MRCRNLSYQQSAGLWQPQKIDYPEGSEGVWSGSTTANTFYTNLSLTLESAHSDEEDVTKYELTNVPASTPRWVPDGPNVVFHVGPIWVFPAWPHIGVANGHRMGPIWGNNGYPCGAQIEPTKYPDEAHIETTWYLGAAHMVPAAAHTGPRFNPNGTQI